MAIGSSTMIPERTGERSIPLTAALLTPDGRGAIATVRMRGDGNAIADQLHSCFSAANGGPLDEREIGRVVFGRWGRDVPEDVVVCRIDERTVEIHCHGGSAASRRILGDLQSAGAIVALAFEMTKLAGGRFQRDMLAALSSTRTLRTADLVLEQANGLLENALRDLLKSIRNRSAAVLADFDTLLRFAEFGRHLTEPWRVVLTGRPNVGKSSLINALVGFSRSIVFDQPGTTRDVVTAETAFDGWPVELIDTAGIRESGEALEASGIERARSVLQSADCRVLLLDVGKPLTADDHDLLRTVADPLVIAHKCDLPFAWEPGDVADQYGVAVRCVSSKCQSGVEELQKDIVRRLVPETPSPGVPVPVTPLLITDLMRAREAVLHNVMSDATRILARMIDGDDTERLFGR
jgi:tRNA modification GTPase